MKKIIVTVILLAAGLWGWYYYNANEQEPISHKAEKNIEQDEISVPESKESPESIMENGQQSQELPVGPETKVELSPDIQELAPEDQEAQILEKYRGVFLSLQSEYSGRINALLGEAKAEYLATPDDKKGEAKWALGAKYLKRGAALESECDARFSAILGQMKLELQARDLPVSGVKAAKKEYQSQKSSRRSAILGKAMGK